MEEGRIGGLRQFAHFGAFSAEWEVLVFNGLQGCPEGHFANLPRWTAEAEVHDNFFDEQVAIVRYGSE